MDGKLMPESTTTQQSLPTLKADGIYKSYSHNAVLRGVDLEVRPGEVVALAGENGAGKSTLLKVMAGLVAADEGVVSVAGGQLISSVKDARSAGVTIVPQELAPVPDMTVYGNIFLGREITRGWRGLDRREMVRESERLLQEYGLSLDARRTVGALSTASQQLIEIIKSVSSGAMFILLDEPTSALAPKEVDQFYATVRRLRERGVGMVFTTHKMEEIRNLADRVAILRDGVLIEDRAADDITDAQIVEAMIGRELEELFPAKPPRADRGVKLRLRDVRLLDSPVPINFEIGAGEIVALAGLMGAGRTSLIETIFGLHKPSSGQIVADGRVDPILHVENAISAGLALVPEDRKVSGAVLSMSIIDNAILPNLPRFSGAGWLRKKYGREIVRSLMADLRLKYSSLDQNVETLSGGNQQKVVLGKWLTREVDTLLLDEPTRGVDVGARSEIYKLIVDTAREQGIAVLFASSDMAEVIGLADRVLVMRDHTVVSEIVVDDFESPQELQQEIFVHASGLGASAEGKAV